MVAQYSVTITSSRPRMKLAVPNIVARAGGRWGLAILGPGRRRRHRSADGRCASHSANLRGQQKAAKQQTRPARVHSRCLISCPGNRRLKKMEYRAKWACDIAPRSFTVQL